MLVISVLDKALDLVKEWFVKSTAEKIEDKKEDVTKELDDFRKDGRPTWK